MKIVGKIQKIERIGGKRGGVEYYEVGLLVEVPYDNLEEDIEKLHMGKAELYQEEEE